MKSVTEKDLRTPRFCVYRERVREVRIKQIAVVVETSDEVKGTRLCLNRDGLFNSREAAANSLI